MSSCATPVDQSRQIRDLERRVRALETGISGIKEITGACLHGAETIVPVYSAVHDPVTGKVTLVFASTPGEIYQVQQSFGAVEWEISDPPTVIGDDCDCPPDPPTQFDEYNGDPITTKWTSNEVFELGMVPYFRVRVFPRMISCAPASPC